MSATAHAASTLTQRIAEHLGYCPHSTPQDEADGLAVLDLVASLKAADAALYIDVATARDIIRNALRKAGETVG